MTNASTSQRLARRLCIPAVTLALLVGSALAPGTALARDGHTARTHEHAASAHALMETSAHIGKIVLTS